MTAKPTEWGMEDATELHDSNALLHSIKSPQTCRDFIFNLALALDAARLEGEAAGYRRGVVFGKRRVNS